MLTYDVVPQLLHFYTMVIISTPQNINYFRTIGTEIRFL